ncbi:MAG: tetratricopeptide repeat protein [Cyclobacteriaceae bacterium]
MRLIGLFVIALAISVYGQDSDLLKIKSLNEQASMQLSIDRDSARALSKESFYLNNDRFIDEKAKNLLVVGMSLKFEDKMDSAFVLFTEAGRIAKELGMQKELGVSYWYKAKVWHELSAFEKSRQDYLAASEILEGCKEFETQFKVLNGLGVIEIKQGNYVEALKAFKRSYEIAVREGFENNANRILNNLGEVYALMENYEKALEFNKMALNVSDTSANKGLIVEALINRAKLFVKINNHDSSVYYYSQALKYSEEFRVDRQLANSSLGCYYFQIGEYELSVENFKRNLDDPTEYRRDQTMLYLCKNYLALNEYDSALNYAFLAYNFSKKNGMKESACEASRLISDVYFMAKKFEQSYKYLQEHIECKNLIHNNQEKKQLADLRVQIETIEKAGEIELLKAQANLDQLNRVLIVRVSSLVVFVLFLVIILIYNRSRHNRKIQMLKARNLRDEIEKSKKDLHTQAMHMIRVNNNVLEIEEKLKELKPKVNGHALEVQRLINTIRFNKNQEKDWENFDHYFEGLNSGFSDRLRAEFPSLTLNEIRLCSLLKMNLMNGEIASILNVETKSVTMKKYRLKKKLGLSEGDDLVKYLSSELVEVG